MSEELREDSGDRLQALTEALQSGTLSKVRRMLNALHAAEIAHLIESLPPSQREFVWELVEPENRGETLVHVGDEVRAGLIDAMEPHELLAAAGTLDTDDLADLIQDLPGTVIGEVLRSMDKADRDRLEQVLFYDEDTAGGLMNVDTVTVRADVTLDVVLRYLRRRGEVPEATDSLIVVNRDEMYRGMLPLTVLLTAELDHTVAEVMDSSREAIPAAMPATDVAKRFQDRDLISAAVVNDDGRLLGRITIDDVVDVIRDQADHSVMSMAGLNEEDDIFAPVMASAKRRAFWLGTNLITAFLASWVIGQFQGTLEKVVALAVLMPIVASMGGIAGSQTLTLVIRGLALGQVGKTNTRWLMTKELMVGAINGLTWAAIVAIVAVIWFGDWQIGGIIAIALVLNLIAAALAGVTIPVIMKRFGIDPALAGSVVLTTVTDVVGFLAFLGLATLLLI
ncbi:MAG: magnesium transporter [Gammaproteobacteria bacterium]|nr:magnesium transporter [Gammaproteobacteria bacterium]MDX5374763.1 magnesium transporter [Gammaproteobacteria bacterium]